MASTVEVLFPSEAEMLIDNLQIVEDVAEYGSPRWFQLHETIERLAMQAVLSASKNEDEFVKDFLITSGKIGALIRDLVVSDVWRRFIFGEIVKQRLEPKSTSIFLYAGLHHEVAVATLLETIFYHSESCCEATDDESISELIDYCHRCLVDLINDLDEYRDAFSEDETDAKEHLEELVSQGKRLSFDTAMKCLTLVRYVVDCANKLSLSVMARFVSVHDFSLLLVEILDLEPWKRRCPKTGKMLIYNDAKWKVHEDNEISKNEAQIWLALFQLLIQPEFQRRQDFSSYRKQVITSKLRPKLTDQLLDQLPILVDFRRFIEHLALGSDSGSSGYNSGAIIVEQSAQLYENLVKMYSKMWPALAREQMRAFFEVEPNDLKKRAAGLVKTYNLDCIEPVASLGQDPPICAHIGCGKLADKRCGRCHFEWYCSRQCQVKAWSKHKPACDLISPKAEESADLT